MATAVAATRTAARIREEFIAFFRDRHRHAHIPSSPVVPHGDPTLLFANAGMNQFKEVFLGLRSGAGADGSVRRAVNSQKCIRAGGKHNDLEDVGKDVYHHTFFEMLGNWSFGDYFKAEAIEWAWTLLTSREHWALDPSRLHVTVFEGSTEDGLEADEEAEALWRRFVPKERISRWGRKDNFWEMGETGPCGPCSEIHYDGTPDRSGASLVNMGSPRVVEIWNLVFIQFNRAAGGRLAPLPAKHVDTGMGLERVARVIQGRTSNYDTDLWTPIFRAIQAQSGARAYSGALDDHVDIAYRVIADHTRCLTVALADGARPGNEGRSYVLRRILRRAVRHAHQTLGVEGPLLCDIVPAVVESLGEAFPELRAAPDRIAEIVRDEEESFLRTLDRGLVLFGAATEAARHTTGATSAAGSLGSSGSSGSSGMAVISADDAFRLHDTYGFPIDLTRVMAEEHGMRVDESGYERLMEQARERSRQTTGEIAPMTLPPDAIARLRYLGVEPTQDVDKYHGRPIVATVRAIWNGTDFDNAAHETRRVAVILDRTNHYAEAGGQVGDRGVIASDVFDLGSAPGRGYSGSEPRGDCQFIVEDTQRFGDFVLHVGHVASGTLRVGDAADVQIDRDRRHLIMANHTATHLLNHALREVVGGEVEQRGSLVAPDRLRFDFAAPRALTSAEIEEIETRVNDAIDADETVYADVAPLGSAQAVEGVRAVFGERYPDPVRVVSIGRSVADLIAEPATSEWRRHSIEFCGGTHLATTGEAEAFVVVHEQALAAGIRRVTAVSGPAATAAETAARELQARLDEAVHLDPAGRLEGDSARATCDEIAHLAHELTIGQAARRRLEAGLEPLRERIQAHEKRAKSEARVGVVDQAREVAERESGPVIVETIAGADKETLLSAIDVIRARRPESAALLFAPDEEGGKVAIAALVPPALIGRGLKAGDWVREAAKVCGGGGGGRPDLAQAGGKDPSKIADAAAAARAFAQRVLA